MKNSGVDAIALENSFIPDLLIWDTRHVLGDNEGHIGHATK